MRTRSLLHPTILLLKTPFNCSSLTLPLPHISFSSTPSNKPSLSPILKATNYEKLLEHCVSAKNLILGKVIHSKILTKGLEQDSYFATKLINLYSNCNNLPIAETVFNRFSIHNVFLLNAMIRGYTINGLYQEGLHLFYQKREHGGLVPDSYTFSCVLKACGLLSDLQQGKCIHCIAVGCGLDSDLFVSNSLIAMYGKCGCVINGVQVFERMPKRDIVSWNSIISTYVENGFYDEALVKVDELVRSGLRPDQVTILSVLTICSSHSMVREIHGYVVTNGFEYSCEICNTMISVYGRYGGVEEARGIFDRIVRPDNVAWNALISCYAQNGFFQESTQLLREMKVSGFDADVVTYSGIISNLSQSKMSSDALDVFIEMLDLGWKLDVVNIASILPAIADLMYIQYAKEIHGHSYRNGLESDRRIRNSLISVYDKCGLIQYAASVFSHIDDPDVISWSSMIVGYVQNGYFVEAHKTFREMIMDKIHPNPIAITSVLSACAVMSTIGLGKEVHVWALKNDFEDQTVVGSALIDMYAKCGNVVYSRRVFDLMTEKDSVVYNAMISGYATHGLGVKALEIFDHIKEPDQVSFISILSACNHGGLVDEGIQTFNRMKDFRITPREGHYACMVDILARSGRVEEALEVIKAMPVEATVDVWGALLGASKIHSNLEVGMYSGIQLLDLSCERPGHYVMLSNILADSERWEEVETMREHMNKRGVKKSAGCSFIEVDKIIYSFIANVKTQLPESGSLFRVLRYLNEQMKEII